MTTENLYNITGAPPDFANRENRMLLVQALLNGLWSKLSEFPKYKEFNKEMQIEGKDSVQNVLDLESGSTKLHLSSKTTKKKVVFSYLTIVSTITDCLVDVPLAAMVGTKGKNKGKIVGWKFYSGKDTVGDFKGVKK